MISICISVKDRTIVKTEDGIELKLFINCIDSIVESCRKINYNVELVIVDYNSIDYPLNDWIYEKINSVNNLSIKIISLEHEELFSRGKSLNIAGENANYENLFFCDTDMIMNENVLNEGIEQLKIGNTYFPICLSYTDYTHNNAWWRTAGWGMVFINKKIFLKHKFPEYFKWGKEDEELRIKLENDNSSPIVRKMCIGLFHQWHPLVNGSTTIGIQKIK